MEVDKKVCSERARVSCENCQMLPPKTDKNVGMMPSPLWLPFFSQWQVWNMEVNPFNIQKLSFLTFQKRHRERCMKDGERLYTELTIYSCQGFGMPHEKYYLAHAYF
jgi:hypothetical protein